MRRIYNPQVKSEYAPTLSVRRLPPRTTRLCHTTAGATTEEDDQSDPRLYTTSNQPLTEERDNFDRIASIAREAYDATRVIMGELNVEQKLFVPLFSGNACQTHTQYDHGNSFDISTTGRLNIIPQSVAEAGRTGDSIKMTNLTLDWTLRATAALTGNTVCYVTLLVYYCPGNTSVTSIFGANASALNGLLDFVNSSSQQTPWAPKDYDGDSKKRAVIVGRHTMKVHVNDPAVSHHFNIKLHKKTQYENDQGTTTALTVINTGLLGYAIFSDTNLQTLTTSAVSARLYFVDN
jgi:hypothetical protein